MSSFRSKFSLFILDTYYRTVSVDSAIDAPVQTWSISRIPISRGCLIPADKALPTRRCFSEGESSCDCEGGVVWTAMLSVISEAAFRDPRLARCSLIKP
jgi:hypothetical protein